LIDPATKVRPDFLLSPSAEGWRATPPDIDHMPVADMVSSGDRLLIAGLVPSKKQGGHPDIFASTDGTSWTDLRMGGKDGSVEHMAARPDGAIVVVGHRWSPPAKGTSNVTTGAAWSWSSSDGGKSWSSQAIDPHGTLGALGYSSMLATPDGFLLAVSAGGPVGAGASAEILLSVDGVSWQAVSSHPGAFQLGPLTSVPGGFIAFDSDPTDTWARVLSSPDGRTWTRSGQVDGLANIGGTTITADGRVLAAGCDYVMEDGVMTPTVVVWEGQPVSGATIGVRPRPRETPAASPSD